MIRKYQGHVPQVRAAQNGRYGFKVLVEQLLAGLAWYA